MLSYKEENKEEVFGKIWDVVPEDQKKELITRFNLEGKYQNPFNNVELRKEVMREHSNKVKKVIIK